MIRDGYRAAVVWPEPGRRVVPWTRRSRQAADRGRRLDDSELAAGALRHWTTADLLPGEPAAEAELRRVGTMPGAAGAELGRGVADSEVEPGGVEPGGVEAGVVPGGMGAEAMPGGVKPGGAGVVPGGGAEVAAGRVVGGVGRWGIALVTEGFDVMELPAEYGAVLNHRLKASCPTAMAPAKRRWLFFVVEGSVDREQVVGAGGVLHSGPKGWVPAPGTWMEETGRIRWLVHPYLTEWRPYQRRDPIDLIFL